MNHTEATELKATERYLLNELTPDQRDAFEEHYFDCQECAEDLRAASVFVEEAKVQLPALVADTAPARQPVQLRPERRKPWWSFLTLPAFAAPAFAALLAVIAYQNFATIPALRSAADEPRVTPWTMLHAGTRGSDAVRVDADRHNGATVFIDLPLEPVYASYAFDLTDPAGKRVWGQTIQRTGHGDEGQADQGMRVSLLIPGAHLQPGTYTLTISGISPDGAHAPISRRALDVHLDQ